MKKMMFKSLVVSFLLLPVIAHAFPVNKFYEAETAKEALEFFFDDMYNIGDANECTVNCLVHLPSIKCEKTKITNPSTKKTVTGFNCFADFFRSNNEGYSARMETGRYCSVGITKGCVSETIKLNPKRWK